MGFSSAGRVYDGLRIDITDNAVDDLSLTTTVAATAVLSAGLYDVWASADCYIASGTDLSTLTTANGRPLAGGETPSTLTITPNIQIEEGEKLGGITASGIATLYYQKVD